MTTENTDGIHDTHSIQANSGQSNQKSKYGEVNYIKQLNGFWEKSSEDLDFKQNYKIIYLALLHINNSCGWKPEFEANYKEVMHFAGVKSKDTYYESLDFLQLKGFIHYKKGSNNYTAARFRLPLLYEKLGKQTESTQKVSRKQTESSGNTPKHSKPNKHTKQVNNISNTDNGIDYNNTVNVEGEFTALINDSSKKEKKLSPDTEVYNACKDIFCNLYSEKFSTKYDFEGAKDGASLKKIIGKITGKCQEAGMEATTENIKQGFSIFLDSIFKDPKKNKWIIDSLTISLINSQFNPLFKNAKPTNNSKKSAVSDFLNNDGFGSIQAR